MTTFYKITQIVKNLIQKFKSILIKSIDQKRIRIEKKFTFLSVFNDLDDFEKYNKNYYSSRNSSLEFIELSKKF